MPQRNRREPQRGRGQGCPKIDLTGLVDVSVQVGLVTETCRMTHEDYNKLVQFWQFAREDVTLRQASEDTEHQVVLRGTESGRLAIRPAQQSQGRAYRQWTVTPHLEAMEAAVEQHHQVQSTRPSPAPELESPETDDDDLGFDL